LTLAQQQLSYVQSYVIGARIVGIVFGCFLGMFPLLLMPEKCPRLVDQIAARLSSTSRTEFTSRVKTLHFHRGEKLLQWGEKSNRVFMVQSGQLEVVGRDIEGLPFTVCSIGPGHAFGIPALHAPSHVDLVARDDEVVVQAISKDDFLMVLENEEASELYENARSLESQVYLRSQGRLRTGPRAEKGTGKTRLFASLRDKQKLEVLACTGLEEAKRFSGRPSEGKVRFFANLTEEQKCNALTRWQELQNEQRQAHEAQEASHTASLV